MALYDKKVDRHMKLTAYNGKQLPVITVISGVIGYLKDHVMKTVENQVMELLDKDIRWVLTVPAIWSDSAKQLMREAAEEAGISANKLILVLEPEAASILCKQLPVKHLASCVAEDQEVTFQAGTKYLVLDAGGGTIDITVHQVTTEGYLKEIHKSNGGDWGGAKVNKEFENLLESIVGKEAYTGFKYSQISNCLDLYQHFEIKKRTLKEAGKTSKVTFTLPSGLSEIIHKQCSGQGNNVAISDKLGWSLSDIQLTRDKLRLSQEKVKALFEPSLRHIQDHVSGILSYPDVEGCSAILMVGGFSECSLLQDAIRNIAGDIRVIIPNDPGLAVLKGAVINGHHPEMVSQRICKNTYGVETRFRFIEGVHREDYRVTKENGDIRCENCFSSFVTRGTHVHFGTSSVTKPFNVISSNQTSVYFGIYASTSDNPVYTTDDSVKKIGCIELDMPDTSRSLDREAKVTMYFGGSEIEVKAVDEHSGNEIRVRVDFLG